ncbi:Cytochrome c oxidase subunit 6B [Borealophlyctis nickersoniae]|nr:Cytochrome c oxidase subunit 6B [Borealophlyctis nickersoniae]
MSEPDPSELPTKVRYDIPKEKRKMTTIGFDARFPNMNQTRNCSQNYIDYFKCIRAKGEDYAPCEQFRYAYQELCPNSWIDTWDEQREAGTHPALSDWKRPKH